MMNLVSPIALIIYRVWLCELLCHKLVAIVTSDVTPCFQCYNSYNHGKYRPRFVNGVTPSYHVHSVSLE
jgi:hypothetical protein